jgi:NAD(P)-dependent dehydrogenase (short-subunit alcohol dehydrogenase family)
MILDQFKLDGRVALVTGATRGLGQAFAVALAEAGADIVTLDRSDTAETQALLNSESKKTIQLGLRMFIQQYSADYALIMAASLVSLIPLIILFLSFQRFFVEGIATTGIKG